MARILFISLFLFCGQWLQAQTIKEITFNLYTDSLKKGFYNYISVDGRLSDGNWLPLDSSHIMLKANTGHFKGNDLFIDSTYTLDSVWVTATLKNNNKMRQVIVIYIRKRGFTEPLQTEESILNQTEQKPRRRKGIF